MSQFSQHRKVIAIIGWRAWVRMWPNYLRVSDAWAWVERVIYCHHNARVLCDMEWRLGRVLCECTRGMSKAYYDLDTMLVEIQDHANEKYEEALEEGRLAGREEMVRELQAAGKLPK